ncbi:MAG TPA: GFA family protein [Candidatus Binataceae bacterium]
MPGRQRVTGGCLCGAVRYQATVAPADVHYCHCRMCQRAFGNVFAMFASFPKDSIRFIGRKPKLYHSSRIAKRGHCARCGTPLTMEGPFRNDKIGISVGSLDHPERVRPKIHWGIESQVPWLRISDRLARKRTMDDPVVAEAWRKARKLKSKT